MLPEDIYLWGDGTTVFRSEYFENYLEYAHLGDEFEIITYEDPEYDTIAEGM